MDTTATVSSDSAAPTITTQVGRSYTTGRRQPYLIRKWPGSNVALPMGPYTITQMAMFAGSVFLLISYREVWAHFGAFNLVLGLGVPVALVYMTRYTRIEGRDPLRAATALGALLCQPRRGYLNGVAVRARKPQRVHSVVVPVGHLPAELWPACLPSASAQSASLPASPVAGRWVFDLVGQAARIPGRRP